MFENIVKKVVEFNQYGPYLQEQKLITNIKLLELINLKPQAIDQMV